MPVGLPGQPMSSESDESDGKGNLVGAREVEIG
jgi:hypothetical protein